MFKVDRFKALVTTLCIGAARQRSRDVHGRKRRTHESTKMASKESWTPVCAGNLVYVFSTHMFWSSCCLPPRMAPYSPQDDVVKSLFGRLLVQPSMPCVQGELEAWAPAQRAG